MELENEEVARTLATATTSAARKTWCMGAVLTVALIVAFVVLCGIPLLGLGRNYPPPPE